jgi:hypothetical protein
MQRRALHSRNCAILGVPPVSHFSPTSVQLKSEINGAFLCKRRQKQHLEFCTAYLRTGGHRFESCRARHLIESKRVGRIALHRCPPGRKQRSNLPWTRRFTLTESSRESSVRFWRLCMAPSRAESHVTSSNLFSLPAMLSSVYGLERTFL